MNDKEIEEAKEECSSEAHILQLLREHIKDNYACFSEQDVKIIINKFLKEYLPNKQQYNP